MNAIVLTHYTATTCTGTGQAALLHALQSGTSGLRPCTFDTVDFATCTGQAPDLSHSALPAHLSDFECRNNRLAYQALQADGFAQAVRAAVQRHGAHRVCTLLGTSTSGIYSTELAYRARADARGALPAHFHYAQTHNAFSVADFVRTLLGLQGAAAVCSTACSSSAKVFASAARLLQAGLAEAVVVGGVDTLCLTTLYGFHALGLTSTQPCKPWDAARSGLSIGEGAAFALLERRAPDADDIWLQGYGESSDAYHMSAPHPQGRGAAAAMRAALESAQCSAQDVHYINLHGTATPSNDTAEGQAIAAVFGTQAPPPCSSTKGITGHTLGAAGALEALVCALALRHGFIPGSAGTHHNDPQIPVASLLHTQKAPHLRRALSNSFGFGGSNCSLLLARGLH